MSSEETVRVEGLRDLIRTLKAAEQDLDDLKAANRTAAQVVADVARARAPRRTGRLAGTGRPGNAARKATVTFGRASVPYANPIHWGWPRRHIQAQPFLLDAARATRFVWMDAYLADLQKILDSVKGA